MRLLVLGIFALVFIAGCTNLEQKIDEAFPSANYDLLKTQYDELVAQWEANISNNVFVEVDNFTVSFPAKLSIAKTSCKNAMRPAFDCEDIVVETNEIGEIEEQDIVSFMIFSDEAKFFGEQEFAGNKTIYRRIHDIRGNGYIMKADTFDEPHDFFVPSDRIRTRVVAVFYDGKITEIENPVFHNDSSKNFKELQKDYFDLVDRFNSFLSSVFVVRLKDFDIFIDRNLTSVSLACTGSMRPTFDCGDIIIERPVGKDEVLKKGDVVSFTNITAFYLRNDPSSTILHRIFRIDQGNGTIYVTKGDNNLLTDAKIPADKIEGKLIAAFFREDPNF